MPLDPNSLRVDFIVFGAHATELRALFPFPATATLGSAPPEPSVGHARRTRSHTPRSPALARPPAHSRSLEAHPLARATRTIARARAQATTSCALRSLAHALTALRARACASPTHHQSTKRTPSRTHARTHARTSPHPTRTARATRSSKVRSRHARPELGPPSLSLSPSPSPSLSLPLSLSLSLSLTRSQTHTRQRTHPLSSLTQHAHARARLCS
jgi:hypothetical protein